MIFTGLFRCFLTPVSRNEEIGRLVLLAKDVSCKIQRHWCKLLCCTALLKQNSEIIRNLHNFPEIVQQILGDLRELFLAMRHFDHANAQALVVNEIFLGHFHDGRRQARWTCVEIMLYLLEFALWTWGSILKLESFKNMILRKLAKTSNMGSSTNEFSVTSELSQLMLS